VTSAQPRLCPLSPEGAPEKPVFIACLVFPLDPAARGPLWRKIMCGGVELLPWAATGWTAGQDGETPELGVSGPLHRAVFSDSQQRNVAEG
jgi:hypothetical protein